VPNAASRLLARSWGRLRWLVSLIVSAPFLFALVLVLYAVAGSPRGWARAKREAWRGRTIRRTDRTLPAPTDTR
jgi:hypothetical protein